jgi:hypothetical protein
MHTFQKVAAQGDVAFRRVDRLPDGLTEVSAEKGEIIVTHSETGHHHTMVLDGEANKPNVRMYSGDNPLLAWLEVSRPSVLGHKRSFDTHEPILFSPGIYEVRRQREYTAEGYRQVQD